MAIYFRFWADNKTWYDYSYIYIYIYISKYGNVCLKLYMCFSPSLMFSGHDFDENVVSVGFESILVANQVLWLAT